MSSIESAAAWADFWATPSGGGCLAALDQEFEKLEASAWRPLAAALPRKTAVLDIGTGDGIVLQRLHKLRPDLRLTGIDSSPHLPASPKGMKLKPGIAAESLPFADASIDAVVSRYGYEYGATAAVAAEAARVTKAGGKLLLIVHHRASPVVAWNERRAAALRWAAMDSGYLDKARAYANSRLVARLPVPAPLLASVREAASRFPADPVAAEVLTGMLQTIDPRFPPAQSLQALGMLERRAKGELARLAALESAARDESGIAAIAAELEAAGFAIESPSPMIGRDGPLAWLVRGTRR